METYSLKNLIIAIMRTIFFNNYNRIISEQTFADSNNPVYHLTVPHNSGFASIEGTHDLKKVRTVVNSLPHVYKVPFSMHVSGFKSNEIARKLGLPLGTVKSRIFFTCKWLQQELKSFV